MSKFKILCSSSYVMKLGSGYKEKEILIKPEVTTFLEDQSISFKDFTTFEDIENGVAARRYFEFESEEIMIMVKLKFGA